MTFLGTIHDLKLVLALIAIVMSTLPIAAYGQTSPELGHRLIPDKIVENAEGVLQVYIMSETIVPGKIDNLVVTSSDSSIIQVLEIGKNENGFITPVKIKAVGSGTANIALAAPGFSSTEFPITVYGNKNYQAQLLIKTTPSTFSINGPDKGYVSVELADEDGFPARAGDDLTITLTTSTSDIISLENTELIIKKGEYFAIGEFQVNQPGIALIYASSPAMETVSSQVTVSEISEPLTIKLYVYPNKISSFSTNYAYAIVQLQDSNGNPIKATQNIPVSFKITNSALEQSVNTSGEFPGITISDTPQIKKGSYWAYAKLVTRGGLEGTYDVNVFAKDYLVSSSQPLEIVSLELLDDKSPVLDILPVLTSGQKELVGVMHLENEVGDPVAASKALKIVVDSSDERTFSIQDVQIDKGFGASLVFAQVGYAVPETLTLSVVSGTTIDAAINGSTKEALTLVTEPLVPKVLSETNFPLALYLTDDEESAYFPEDMMLSIPPNEFVHVEPKIIKKGESITLLDSKALKEGSGTLNIEAGDFSTSAAINNLSSKPAMLHLNYPETILTNLMNTFVVQILDAKQQPVFANQDTEIKFVLNDKSLISMPESIIIKKGEYYTLFDVDAKTVGTTELSVLASDLPLTKFEITVNNIIPQISISSHDYVNPNSIFDATVTVQHLTSPLSGMNVEWNVQGATIQSMDSVTNENGMARISLLAQDPTTINVEASVSGGVFSTHTVSKQIMVNLPLEPASTSNMPSFGTMGTLFFIIIPVAAAAIGFIILKKKNMLNGLTERISTIEKINEVKEKFSHLREK